MPSPYEVLGVEHSASRAEITAAYRRAAMRYHPDRNPDDPTAKEKFQEIEQAHRLLLKLAPSVRVAPKTASPPPPPPPRQDLDDAVNAWRAGRDREEARRQAYEQKHHAEMQRREKKALARGIKIKTPLLSLCTLCAAAVAWLYLPPPFNFIALLTLLLVTFMLVPPAPDTYTDMALATLIRFIVKCCFIGLVVWSTLLVVMEAFFPPQ